MIFLLDPIKDNFSDEDEKNDTEDDDEPEGETKSASNEKSEVLPPITEGKADAPAPAAIEAKGEEEGKKNSF